MVDRKVTVLVVILVLVLVLHVNRFKRRLGVARVWIFESLSLKHGGAIVDGKVRVHREFAGEVISA